MPTDRLNELERRTGVLENRAGLLEQADARREATLSSIVISVTKLEKEMGDQTTLLHRILGGISAGKWVIGGLAVGVPALWWLFQHLPK